LDFATARVPRWGGTRASGEGGGHLKAAGLGALGVVDDANAALYALLVVDECLDQLQRLEGAHDG